MAPARRRAQTGVPEAKIAIRRGSRAANSVQAPGELVCDHGDHVVAVEEEGDEPYPASTPASQLQRTRRDAIVRLLVVNFNDAPRK
jgi:hypothetical protein